MNAHRRRESDCLLGKVATDANGGATVELLLATPLLLMVLLLVLACGRIATARADVDGAARDAARAASIRRDPASASLAARQAVAATLAQRSITCRQLQVVPDLRAFRPGGWVAVSVTCAVDLRDLTLLPLPGSRAVQSRFVEPIDVFRGGASP